MAEKKDYDKIHNNNTEVFAKKVATLFDDATKEGANIAMLVSDFNDDKLFSFADYPITKDRVQTLIKSLSNNIQSVVLNGIDHEWTLPNNKNSELSRLVFGDNIGKLTKEQEQRYFNNNISARDAFKARETAGLKLSDRVWKYTNKFKTDIELGIDLGLRDRLSAVDMAKDLKQYLVYPDKLFRRVRDQHGNLKLSKAAKAFNPGQGIYRSSVRNAQRLTRTEINIAYHTADHARWQQLDFVVGIEVRRSNNIYNCPMCDSLKGKYPKDFMFTGWHPQCRCHAISILKTPEELDSNKSSANEVTTTPKGFDTWIENNKERFNSNNTPYFIRDNYVDGKISKGLNLPLCKTNNDINVLIGKAENSGSFVQDIAKSIAANNGSLVTPINFKSESSIKRKMETDKCGISDIKDAVRTTIIAPRESINIVLSELQKDPSFIRLKKQNPDNFMGYSGNIVNIRTNTGIIAEIQVNTDKMIYAKEKPGIAKSIIGEHRWMEINKEINLPGGLGHQYYEQWRVLNPVSNEAKVVAKEMSDYYINFQ